MSKNYSESCVDRFFARIQSSLKKNKRFCMKAGGGKDSLEKNKVGNDDYTDENEKLKLKLENAFWGAHSDINVFVNNESRQQTINILMPEVAPHMSAGPLSILYFAKFLLGVGYKVRFLIDTAKTKDNIYSILKQQSDDLTEVVEAFEVEAFPLKKRPTVVISQKDMTVATLFNSASAAKKIQSFCNDKKFIYFIQDDERTFFPAGTLQCIAEESYNYNYYPLFSTDLLKDFFVNENVGNINSKNLPLISQGCPSNFYLPKFDEFVSRGKRKKFVFYARPQTPRNCFDYAMYIIYRATELKLFDEGWDLYGMGFQRNEDIELANSCSLHLIPNMPLKDYKNMLHTFDVGLSLMATPHPSMPPIDLALSGCVVVTNSCKNKTATTMSNICKNIKCAEISVSRILESLKEAIEESDDLKQRYNNAKQAQWPKTWDETFTNKHSEWIRNIMRGAR